MKDNDAKPFKDANAEAEKQKPFRTQSVSLGRLKIGSLDNVAEVLAATESEDFE